MKDLKDFRDFSKIQVTFYVDESVFFFVWRQKNERVVHFDSRFKLGISSHAFDWEHRYLSLNDALGNLGTWKSTHFWSLDISVFLKTSVCCFRGPLVTIS